MTTLEFWIQIEPNPWDLCPNNIDRMTGQKIVDREASSGSPGPAPTDVTLHSPVTGVNRTVKMFKPLGGGALILRRYTADWAAPDDRKVNPWDLNEHDPTDTGTMGTIPGPVIECDVNDDVIVHFRNGDHRREPIIFTPLMAQVQGLAELGLIGGNIGNIGGNLGFNPDLFTQPIDFRKRAHSLHPHGFVFAPTSDGAYPLSPQDHGQPIPVSEKPFWDEVGVKDFKQGDRVPSGATFDYHWQTLGWPTTAGVWLYHDHSINDEENVNRGAIGIIVIHNTTQAVQQQDVEPQDLPGGLLNGSPIIPAIFNFETPIAVAAHLLPSAAIGGGSADTAAMAGMAGMEGIGAAAVAAGTASLDPPPADSVAGLPSTDLRVVGVGGANLVHDVGAGAILGLLQAHFRTPPTKALYLQLFHGLQNGATCINGRQYLGNTPTMVAGQNTLMRFGVVGMGSDFHTFHIHGHRWTINGPDGNDLNSIMVSPQLHPVSQFEDTRTFGPANSFVFSINEGEGFMRASPAKGEWHMHCHVLNHMMMGMMGSLLVVDGGDVFFGLPHGVPMPDMGGMTMGGGGGDPMAATVHVKNTAYNPSPVTIKRTGTVTWSIEELNHTVTDNGGAFAFGTAAATLPMNAPNIAHTYNTTGDFAYHCEFHGAANMSGIVHVVN